MVTDKEINEILIEYVLNFKAKFEANRNDFEPLIDEIIMCSPTDKNDIIKAFICYSKSLKNPFINCKLNPIQRDIYYSIGRYFDRNKLI